MNDLTFNILKIIVSISFALITVYLIPVIKNLLASEKYKDLVDIVKVAVFAAEQTIGAGNGKVKKEEVVAFVTNWMNEHGFVISQDQLSQLIEAAVFEMNKELK